MTDDGAERSQVHALDGHDRRGARSRVAGVRVGRRTGDVAGGGADRTRRRVASRRVARFGAVEEVARRLAALADDDRREVIERYRSYATRLTLVELDDRQVARARIAWWRLVLSGVAIFLAGPLLLTATLIYLPGGRGRRGAARAS